MMSPTRRTPARLRRFAVAGVALTALVLAGCGSSASEQPSAFVIVTAAQPPSFSYETSATGYEAGEFWANTGATLIRNPYAAGEGEMSASQDLFSFEPLLAERYEVSDDRLTYTFYLDPDAMSVAGNPVTAEDVLFSIKRKFETPTSVVPFVSAPALTDPDTQVSVIDESTVSITISDPGYGFTLLSMLANQPYNIYDSTVLIEHATEDDPYAVTWSETNASYGFGAYELTDYTPGEQMVYTANPGYVLGEPDITTIVQRVVPDAGQRANLVRSGDAQIATQLRPADQIDLADSGAAQIFTVPTNAFVYIPLLTTAAPFDDPEVRRAFSLAIPYGDIIDDVYRGRLDPVDSILSDAAPGFDGEGLAAPEHDPVEAQEILDAAGYTEPVEFTLTVNSAVPDLEETAVLIQSAAADAGFSVTVDSVSSAVFQEGLASKSFQASMGRDYAIVQSPPYVLSLFYTPGSPLNWPNWEDAAFSDALAAGNAVGDPLTPEAGQWWNEAQRVLQTELPTVYVGYVQPLNAFGTDVGGYVFRTDNVIDYSQLTLESE
ncbi:ABC transporter substrate-binding protein [Microbacterium chocolatum]|uniref:ABC transporter substrate-binding protein n=1 Tax=Microbacterium aurantiacum TaxID=162393 RepID=UPI00338F2BEB